MTQQNKIPKIALNGYYSLQRAVLYPTEGQHNPLRLNHGVFTRLNPLRIYQMAFIYDGNERV